MSGYGSFNVSEKKDALNTLASRPAYAADLLAAVGSGTVAPKDVSADIVRDTVVHEIAPFLHGLPGFVVHGAPAAHGMQVPAALHT